MIIPLSALSSEVLTNIVREFVLREGTDYGDIEQSMEEKMAAVHNQLNDGSAVIVYSELHETVNIMPAEQFKESD